jgi:hypothetical protein
MGVAYRMKVVVSLCVFRAPLAKIKKDIVSILIPRIIAKNPAHAHLFNDAIQYHIQW